MRAAFHLDDPETVDSLVTLDELPQSLVLNSFGLRCPGVHHVTRLPRPESREARRALERELATSLFAGEKSAYAPGEVTVPGGHVVDLACDAEAGLHVFDLRAAIAAQARHRGFTAWFGFGGEIHVIGLPGEQRVGSIVVQRRLRLRVLEEGWDEPETRVVARQRTRWLVAGTLADPDVSKLAIGESAERLDGRGPSRGEIVSFEGDDVVLRNRGRDERFPSADYALRASSSFVRRHHGAGTFRALQVASGSLTQSGKKNQYAVKDRFGALVEDLHAIGLEIEMPGGRQAVIEPSWVEVRVQGTA
jgi:hypothetical protein